MGDSGENGETGETGRIRVGEVVDERAFVEDLHGGVLEHVVRQHALLDVDGAAKSKRTFKHCSLHTNAVHFVFGLGQQYSREG
eukprot:1746473-Rhodomonas_salina.4